MVLHAWRADDRHAALALALERQVLGEASADALEWQRRALAPYDHATVLACVVDQRRLQPAGMLRLILPSARGLRALRAAEAVWGVSSASLFGGSGLVHDPARTFDIATVAVAADYRRSPALQGTITMALLQAASVLGASGGLARALAVFDVSTLRMLQWKFQRPFTLFAGIAARPYLGSPACLPVWADLADWHARLATRDPVLHGVMALGRGLEPVVRPPDWAAAAALVREVSALADLRLHLR